MHSPCYSYKYLQAIDQPFFVQAYFSTFDPREYSVSKDSKRCVNTFYKALFIGFHCLSTKSSRWGLNPPICFFQQLVSTTFLKRFVFERSIECSLNTSHVNFSCQLRDRASTKLSSQTSLICCEFLNSMICFRSFAKEHLCQPNVQRNSCQTLMHHAFNFRLLSLFVELLTEG